MDLSSLYGPPCILLIYPTTSKRPDIVILNEARTLTQAKDATHSGHPACHGGRELWFHPGHILPAILGRGLFQYLCVSSPGMFSLSCVRNCIVYIYLNIYTYLYIFPAGMAFKEFLPSKNLKTCRVILRMTFGSLTSKDHRVTKIIWKELSLT